MKQLSPRTYLLRLLALLMASHLSVLAYGGIRCVNLSITTAEKQCDGLETTFQRAVEAYVAVILALMAKADERV